MTEAEPLSDLPVVFTGVGIDAGGVTILDGLDLAIGTGPTTVVIGPNGAGKTTLLRAAMGLVSVTRGRLTWAGRSASPPVRRSMLFQQSAMLRRSVVGNLRYALAAAGISYRERRTRTVELLTLVGLEALATRPARALSGGERRRLAFARALARNPELLILDEPTAGLDPAATRMIENLVLATAACGVTIVMSTHDLGQARRLGGRIVLLHRGRVVEDAGAAAFFAGPATPEAARFVAGELLL